MRYTKAAIFLFFSIVLQISFLRLIIFSSFTPNIFLIFLFILSYQLPFFGFLFLAVLFGAFIYLFSVVNLSVSLFALVASFLIGYIIREKIFKRKNLSNILFCSIAVFFCFYLFLFIGITLLNFFGGHNFIFNFFEKKTIIEIMVNALCAAFSVYFLKIK